MVVSRNNNNAPMLVLLDLHVLALIAIELCFRFIVKRRPFCSGHKGGRVHQWDVRIWLSLLKILFWQNITQRNAA